MRRQVSSEELHHLYALIGAGIWQLQNVEDALDTYITLKADVKVRGGMSPEQAEENLEKHRRNTLGTSLKKAKSNGVLSSPLQERAERFKEERDWLVHRSAHNNGADLYVDETRYALMDRIRAFTEEAQKLQKLIASELEGFVVAQGVDRGKIAKEAESRINKLKGNEA